VKVKICGITRQEDAELAIELGADALGFVFEPNSPRCLTPAQYSMIRGIEPYVLCVAVYGQAGNAGPHGCNAVQLIDVQTLYGILNPPVFKVLRPVSSDPTVLRWQLAEWLGGQQLTVKAVVLDAFDEHNFGGTGKTIDWDFAAAFVSISPLPVILAGGLTPDNVGEAIHKVQPYAVDVSSGVESSPGIKDPSKLRAFVQAVRGI
jgi:phosphoribosylanthranilate isomerase